MFDISFVENECRGSDVCLGQIVLGSFVEKIEAPLEYWNIEQYEHHWGNAVELAVESGVDSCLITSITDPASANHISWWPLYVNGSDLRVQNQLLFLDELDASFDISRPELSLRQRETVSDLGEPISEWKISRSLLKDWLARGRV